MPEIESIKIVRGQFLDPHETIRQLLAQGYQRVAKVSDPGDCTIRGGLVDIFPEGFDAPIRIELDGESVTGIRSVHPATGKPFFTHEMVIILPAVSLHRKSLKTSVKHLFFSEESPLDPFVDIRVGDLVVHVTHGIGRYLGLKKVRGATGVVEHIALEYADGDRLYVPLEEMHLLQKYLGFEGKPPKLSKLGTRYWERSKEWARKGAASVAFELLNIQAKRLSLPGFSFGPDNDWQKELESDFPHKETAGQLKAVKEIKADMESHQPMDRLLCGDVGYGKTEVALRAAFKAVTANKQVALLCPTTILAEQHYNTFSERMKKFPVEVAMLSRFQTPAETVDALKRLAKGEVDILIGTHRLLSKDVHFKDLGLLIVDEEQRFGVRHKEQLKKLRAEVDVLAMTATPIPRTLYLAVMGAKSMSVIDTPPFERLPVETVVSEENDEMIRHAVEREIERGGQVFVIFPWIEEIGRIYKKISALVPKARMVLAHGQMPSRALEKAMLAFMHREADVLVSTAIVESGIDIPNANTILVFRSESFGLADLYQLRGRVGRFTRQAHAYFLTPRNMPLSGDAQKRLHAIEEFSSLGAGFQVALQDLQLRGAGNLLGTEQHGHISAVGFDLYCRLLKSEIEKIKKAGAGDASASRATGLLGPKPDAGGGTRPRRKHLLAHRTRGRIPKVVSGSRQNQ